MDKLALEILEKLNALYTNAFGQLVTYTVGLVAFVGLLIPLVVTYIQNRAFRREGEAVTKSLQEEAKKIREELKQSLKEELSKDIAESEKRLLDTLVQKDTALTKKISNVDAGVFHVQATVDMQRELFGLAAMDYSYAASNYLIAEDELNLRRVLPQISESLDKTDEVEFRDNAQVEKAVRSTIKSLSAGNINGRYTDMIAIIDKALQNAKERKRQVAQ